MTTDENRELRTLRYQKKQLGKQLGKAGELIHRLRHENAALRVYLRVNPGDYERLLEQLRAAQAENRRLREKLDTPLLPEGSAANAQGGK